MHILFLGIPGKNDRIRTPGYPWTPLDDIMSNAALNFVKKVIDSPNTILYELIQMESQHSYNTRKNYKLPITRFKKAFGQKSFTYWAAKIYNQSV